MKSRPSIFWFTLISSAAAAVYFGVPSNTATAADETVTAPSASAPVMPTAPAAPTAAAPATAPAPAPALAYGVGEVVKMYQGGINKDVIVNYINNTVLPFHLTADNIIYLQSLGVPQEITKTLIQRDGQLQQQAAQQYYQQQAVAAAAAAQNGAATALPGQYPPGQYPPGQVPPSQPVEVVTPSTPPPAVTYVGTDYPYTYPYPYYYDAWPYYYSPLVVGGWGWGWGWGGHGGWGRGFHGGYGGGFHGGGGFRGGGGGGFHGGGGGGHGH
jgi:hypothetical protein